MRDSFVSELTIAAETDRNICFLTGDMGYSVLENLQSIFKDRFYNVGIAEQNMMGIAAGLALSGNTVFTYTFCNFSSFRCAEQVRNDICYHNANVKIIGIGAGYSYGTLGMTHLSIDDIPLMATFPNMTIINPCDPIESRLTAKAAINHEGPCYIRLRKKGENNIHQEKPDFRIGKGITLKDGEDITLIGSGWILNNVMEAANKLVGLNISPRVISMHTIKPIDREIILKSAKETGAVITVEDQNVQALGRSVAMELMTSEQRNVKFKAIGLTDNYYAGNGTEEYHLNRSGLSVTSIASAAIKLVRER